VVVDDVLGLPEGSPRPRAWTGSPGRTSEARGLRRARLEPDAGAVTSRPPDALDRAGYLPRGLQASRRLLVLRTVRRSLRPGEGRYAGQAREQVCAWRSLEALAAYREGEAPPV